MKTTFLITGIAALTVIVTISCVNGNSFSKEDKVVKSENAKINTPQNDSIAIMNAFEIAKSDKKFIADLGLEDEKQFHFNEYLIKIFRGDLDGNGSEDAMLFFSIEGRGGGNNWDAHYAAFLNQNNHWKYITQIEAGGDFRERILFLKSISNGKIQGNLVGNKDESLPEIPVEYSYKNGEFINTFTALHKENNDEREYLSIVELQNADNASIPLTGTLKEYETLLGKGKITSPKEPPECGTYFDEEPIRYLEFSNLKFELNVANRAAWLTVFMPKSGLKIQTDKGTITEKTTINELKSIFYKADSWNVSDTDKEYKTFVIPDGIESNNQLHLLFDKSGKLLNVSLFVPC